MADLITLDEYKDSQSLKDLKNDTRLNTLIASVSQLVKTYCATSFVDFYSSDKTEVFNVDWETNVVQLGECPVISITSVEERLSYSSSYITLVEGDLEYYLDPNTDSLLRTTGTTYKDWALGPGSVKVIYKGGYVTAPEDLKLAVIDLVKYYFKDEYKERRTLQGASISNTPTSTQWKNLWFPDHIKIVLDLYKQIQI